MRGPIDDRGALRVEQRVRGPMTNGRAARISVVSRGISGRGRRLPVASCVALFLLVLVAYAVAARPGAAAPGESDVPIANPDLTASCGIDILVVLDASGSIASSNATGDVQAAFRALTAGLKNTGSRIAVAQFSTVATVPVPMYTTVTDATIASTFDPYINSYHPDGSTDWEDGFRAARYFLPRPSQAEPHLVMFITDGDPNRVVKDSQVTYDPGNTNPAQNEYELKVPLSENETTSTDDDPAKDAAVSNANALKVAGSHVLVVAVGNGLSSQDSLDRIIDVSGPDVFTGGGGGTFNISTDDVYKESDFSKLEAAMRDAAFALCAPSVNVEKLVDVDPDPAVDDLQPASGWSMTAIVGPPPASWVLPAGASGTTATTSTGADGFAHFQWKNANRVDSSVSVTEAVQEGYVNDPSKTTCTYRTPDTPSDLPLPGFSVTNGGFSGTVPDRSIVNCTIVNRLVPAPAVSIKKFTNGADANASTGPPFIPAGQQVTWTYLVTNPGNVPLSNVAVTDDHGVVPTFTGGDDDGDSRLDPGETWTYSATGTALSGNYVNTGTVTASAPAGVTPATVTASDPSHYAGVAPGIDIEKMVNGVDADQVPGPLVLLPSTLTWTYVVTNTGNTALTAIAVTDDQAIAVTCPFNTLAVGAPPMTCTATGTSALAGEHENVASVTATSGVGPVADSDPAHYFGETPAVTVEKDTNGDDADAPPGPTLTVGSAVTWTYLVTNTGNVPLGNWQPTDSLVSELSCPRLFILLPGKSATCRAGGVAQAGQYANTATVNATNLLAPLGPKVTATDPSHYFGEQAGIDLEKLTNGQDADAPPGPFVPPGAPVTWTYHVTNSGNTDLANVHVVDLRSVGVTCPQTTLAVAASMDCTASGTATPGQYFNLAFVTGVSPAGTTVRASDPSHFFGAVPGIHIEKATDGVDADEAPGPFIPVGDPVDWTYVVTNTGNVAVSGVKVTDSEGVAVTCPATTLAPGAKMTCTAGGKSVLGQYANIGSVTATGAAGATLTDSDPSHYFGAHSEIHLEKLTNGVDADSAPGPSVPVGSTVTWTYEVTNPGNVPIDNVAVTDDHGVVPKFTGGDSDGDGRLDPGETWTYSASGSAVAGQYQNTATVTGFDRLENSLTDSDPSHYFGTSSGPPPVNPPVTPPVTPPVIPSTPPPPGTSVVRVVKRWVGAHGSTTIFVDRDGKAPFDAHVLADSNGDSVSFAFPLSTQVTVGESPLLGGRTATITCGSGLRAYHGGPFSVTSPGTAGATLVCTIVNRSPAPKPPPATTRHVPKPAVRKPAPKPSPSPILVVDKVASRRTLRFGQTVAFLITVRNRGRGDATRVTVCDRLPDGLVFTRTRGARFVSGDACWRVRRLPAGRMKAFAVRTAPSRTQRRIVIVNVATVTGASSCEPRIKLAASRTGEVCSARAAVVVMPARHKARGGGVTG